MKKLVTLFSFTFLVFAAYSQNVGIGTNAPNSSAQLDVTSTTRGLLIPRMTSKQRIAIVTPANGLMVYDINLSGFYFYNGTSWNPVNNGGGGNESWAISGANIYNNNSGNVGIGTSIGLKEKLSVKGDIFVSFTNPNDLVNGGNRAELNLHGSSTGGARINFLNADTTVGAHINYYRLTNTINQFSFNHGSNTHQLSLHNNGNVGIGLSNPQEKLDVDGTIRSREDVIVDNSVTAAGKIEGAGLVSTAGLTVANASIFGSGVFGVTTAQFTGEITSNTGITINDAAATLTLKTGGNDKGFVQLVDNDIKVGTYSTNTTGKFIVRTGGSDNVFVTSSGNVGIDVPSPIAKLQIMNGSDVSISSHGYLMLGSVTGSNLIFDNNEIMARSAGSVGNLVLQNDGGTVRIGNAAVPSGYKFAINGKMICEEIRIKLNTAWPDYVFDEKYKMLSLADLGRFVKTNKHLPNIPPASEVEKQGHDVGIMQKKMMEKIEELTLYILQQQEQINELKKYVKHF